MGMPATDLERKQIVRTFETSVIDMCMAQSNKDH